MSESIPEQMPMIPQLESLVEEETYTFMAVVDGVVVTGFKVNPRAAYALANNATFIQVPNNSRIPTGSVWDGTNFIVNQEI